MHLPQAAVAAAARGVVEISSIAMKSKEATEKLAAK